MYEWAGLMSAADTYIQTYSHAKLPAHTLIERVKCISVYNYFILGGDPPHPIPLMFITYIHTYLITYLNVYILT